MAPFVDEMRAILAGEPQPPPQQGGFVEEMRAVLGTEAAPDEAPQGPIELPRNEYAGWWLEKQAREDAFEGRDTEQGSARTRDAFMKRFPYTQKPEVFEKGGYSEFYGKAHDAWSEKKPIWEAAQRFVAAGKFKRVDKPDVVLGGYQSRQIQEEAVAAAGDEQDLFRSLVNEIEGKETAKLASSGFGRWMSDLATATERGLQSMVDAPEAFVKVHLPDLLARMSEKKLKEALLPDMPFADKRYSAVDHILDENVATRAQGIRELAGLQVEPLEQLYDARQAMYAALPTRKGDKGFVGWLRDASTGAAQMAPPMVASAFMPVGPATAMWFTLIAGDRYHEYRQSMGRSEASRAALTTAALEAPIELLQVRGLLPAVHAKRLATWARVFGKTKSAWHAASRAFAVGVMRAGGEALEEGLQAGSSNLMYWSVSQAHNEVPELSLEQALDASMLEMGEAVGPLAIMMLPGIIGGTLKGPVAHAWQQRAEGIRRALDLKGAAGELRGELREAGRLPPEEAPADEPLPLAPGEYPWKRPPTKATRQEMADALGLSPAEMSQRHPELKSKAGRKAALARLTGGTEAPATAEAAGADLTDAQREFVGEKVRMLGSVEAVDAQYPDESSPIRRYARALARELYADEAVAPEPAVVSPQPSPAAQEPTLAPDVGAEVAPAAAAGEAPWEMTRAQFETWAKQHPRTPAFRLPTGEVVTGTAHAEIGLQDPRVYGVGSVSGFEQGGHFFASDSMDPEDARAGRNVAFEAFKREQAKVVPEAAPEAPAAQADMQATLDGMRDAGELTDEQHTVASHLLGKVAPDTPIDVVLRFADEAREATEGEFGEMTRKGQKVLGISHTRITDGIVDAIIELFQGSDGETVAHEWGHTFLRGVQAAVEADSPEAKALWESYKKYHEAQGGTPYGKDDGMSMRERFAQEFADAFLRAKPHQTGRLHRIHRAIRKLVQRVADTARRLLGTDRRAARRLMDLGMTPGAAKSLFGERSTAGAVAQGGARVSEAQTLEERDRRKRLRGRPTERLADVPEPTSAEREALAQEIYASPWAKLSERQRDTVREQHYVNQDIVRATTGEPYSGYLYRASEKGRSDRERGVWFSTKEGAEGFSRYAEERPHAPARAEVTFDPESPAIKKRIAALGVRLAANNKKMDALLNGKRVREARLAEKPWHRDDIAEYERLSKVGTDVGTDIRNLEMGSEWAEKKERYALQRRRVELKNPLVVSSHQEAMQWAWRQAKQARDGATTYKDAAQHERRMAQLDALGSKRGKFNWKMAEKLIATAAREAGHDAVIYQKVDADAGMVEVQALSEAQTVARATLTAEEQGQRNSAEVMDRHFADRNEMDFDTERRTANWQDRLKKLVGTLLLGKKAMATDEAIQLYISMRNAESQGHGTPQEQYDRWTEDWTDDEGKGVKSQLVSAAHKTTFSAAMNLSPEQQALADEIVATNRALGDFAVTAGAISEAMDFYTAVIWDWGETPALTGKGGFRTYSPRFKSRKWESILEGWARGARLRVKGATNASRIAHKQAAEAIYNRRLIKEGLGQGVLSLDRLEGWERIEHFNFTKYRWRGTTIPALAKVLTIDEMDEPDPTVQEQRVRKALGLAENAPLPTELHMPEDRDAAILHSRLSKGKVYGRRSVIEDDEGNIHVETPIFAPPKLAKRLNALFGTSGLYKMPGAKALTKYNAILKAAVFTASLFHHVALMRSFYLGGRPGWRHLTPVAGQIKAYKEGGEHVRAFTPELRRGVRRGLTLGLQQEWDEEAVREQGRVGALIDRVIPGAGPVKSAIFNMHKMWTDFLFGRFAPNLKALAYLIEYRHQVKKRQGALDRGEITHDDIAASASKLMNDDFGGLHHGRLQLGPTRQHGLRLLLLAPDWTESNLRTLVKTVAERDPATGQMRFATGMEGQMYRAFWGRIMLKYLAAGTLANLILAQWDDDDFWERYKKAWQSGGMRVLDVDITPLTKAIGWNPGSRTYFPLLGHFKDPIKWVAARPPKTVWGIPAAVGESLFQAVKGKGSIVVRQGLDLATGRNWRDESFNSTAEFFGYDDKGVYKGRSVFDPKRGQPKGGKLKGTLTSYKMRGGNRFSIPFLLYEALSAMPIPAQALFGYIAGQYDSIEAASRAVGVPLRTVTEEEIKARQ